MNHLGIQLGQDGEFKSVLEEELKEKMETEEPKERKLIVEI